MAKTVFKNGRILVAQYRFDTYCNRATVNLGTDVVDVTCFNDNPKAKAPGLKQSGVEIGGFAEGIPTASPTDLQPGGAMHGTLWGLANVPVTIGPDSAGAVGDPCFGFRMVKASYNKGGAIGEAVGFGASLEGSGPCFFGVLMEEHSFTEAGTENSAPQQLGAVAVPQTLYAILHCTAYADADSLVVKLQSSATEEGVYADVVTFSTLTALGHEWESYATAETDTWWRVQGIQTGAGAITYAVSAGIVGTAAA